jgi:DNA polymerase-3 subunit beta
MKLQVLQENLSTALATASRFTSTRAQLPVLGNILLSGKKNKLLVSATNLETSISISVGAQIEKEGEITIPSRVITDIISNLPAGSVNLSVDKEQIKIEAQNFKSTISGMNSADFPSIPQVAGKDSIALEKESFLKALSQVSFAASIDETRPILTGILFIYKKGELILVGTDGFRLSQKRIPMKGIQKAQNIILPKNVLNELLRLSTDEDEVKFSFKKADNQVVFGIGNTVLSSRILEGEFPDFEKIIPKSSKIKVRMDKEEFLRAVKLAAVFARESANVVKFNVKGDSVELSAESQVSGSQETKVDAKVSGLTGKKGFEIAFNYRFLEDFLGAVKEDEIQVELSATNAPGVFTDPKDKDYLHLIMPVKIQT